MISAYRLFHPLARKIRPLGRLKAGPAANDAARRLKGDVPWFLGGAGFGAFLGERARLLRPQLPGAKPLPGLEQGPPAPGAGSAGGKES